VKILIHTLQCKTGDKKQQKQVYINISAGLREAGWALSKQTENLLQPRYNKAKRSYEQLK
jgi:hypothetical protein